MYIKCVEWMLTNVTTKQDAAAKTVEAVNDGIDINAGGH